MSASWQVTRGSSMRKHNNTHIPPNNRPQHPCWTPPMSKRHKDTFWSPSCYIFYTAPAAQGSVAKASPKKKKKKKKHTVCWSTCRPRCPGLDEPYMWMMWSSRSGRLNAWMQWECEYMNTLAYSEMESVCSGLCTSFVGACRMVAHGN